MIAPWIGYILVVTVLLAGVAVMGERIATVQGWPRRWIWLGALVLLAGLAALSPSRGVRAVEPPLRLRVERSLAREPAREALPAAAGERPDPAVLIRWAAIAKRVDGALRIGWLGASLGLLLLFAAAALVLARRRRRWREATLDGVAVLVAPADGPAVVGLWRPRVVIPEWSFALEDTGRRLMLRHEQEHVRARDHLLTQVAALALLAAPWNLPLWWLVRRLRLAIELDCDGRVLARARGARLEPAPEARAYGELLLAVATHRSRVLAAAPALLEHSSALGRRIVAMHPRFPRFRRAHNAAFAAGALLLLTLAGLRRPPQAPVFAGSASVPGWVTAWQPDERPAFTPGQLRERVLEQFPSLTADTGTTIVTLVRGADGAVLRAFEGPWAIGPVLERVARGYGHALELLRGAGTPAGFREADAALFGPQAGAARATARAPVRTDVPASGIEVQRLAPGDIAPGVTYVFVIVLTTA
jgi:bla regulator protein blaR1